MKTRYTEEYIHKLEYDRAMFKSGQEQPYELKKKTAEQRVRQWIYDCGVYGKDYHVSVGGLDSITLLLFIRSLGFDPPAISVSSLEDRSIQEVHRKLGVISLPPALISGTNKRWSKSLVLQNLGFPVLSKETASKIELLQNPSEKNKTVRHAIITGETGEYGGYRSGTRMRLAQKWLDRFGGYENKTEGTNYGTPDFKVSSKCCYYLKEKPCDDWAKEHNSVPFLGLMASEGGRREKSLIANGCNYWGKTTARSCPFAKFYRDDLLRLALELNVPIPEIYGEIKEDENGKLYTTGAQRTGCSICGFGIQLEKRPHRFDKLYERNPCEWRYWMYECCTDDDGNKYGWGKVLDYIGVEWRV